jgi:hypothetical protein
MCLSEAQWYYTFMTLVVVRYEGLFTGRSHISRVRSPRVTSEGKQSFIYILLQQGPYIVYYTEMYTQQQSIFF